MVILKSVDELLEHIEEVQLDVMNLSNESLLKMSAYIDENNLEVNDEISTALQYQDIISQQLNATVEVMEQMRNSIKSFNDIYNENENLSDERFDSLYEQLSVRLEDAKDKKNRFSGNSVGNNTETDDIEFF